jgi:hypothetical protein
VKHNGDGPVIGLDLDGTLGDYHGHFLRFAEGWLGREMPDPATINPGLPLHKFMKTSKTTYRRIKLAYREGGLKRSMPCYDGAREMTVHLREYGCEIWITTSRPYLAHGPIEGDTKHWLKRNGIQYDHVLWGENKYRTLRRVAGNRVVAVLEDLPVMAEQAISVGIPVILRTQPYNTWWDPEEILAERARGLDLFHAHNLLHGQLAKWKANSHG